MTFSLKNGVYILDIEEKVDYNSINFNCRLKEDSTFLLLTQNEFSSDWEKYQRAKCPASTYCSTLDIFNKNSHKRIHYALMQT